MTENLLPILVGIVVLGAFAQWVSWQFGLPSILLLLLFGIIAGPVTNWLEPDAVFGDLLMPVVSLSVAVILYEGGLTLKVAEFRRIGSVIRNLVTIGAAITWAVGTLAAYGVLDLDLSLAALLGAVLVVTGPTVIAPLLRQIRPRGLVGPVLKWEGIVIDPLGALLAVLIFEAIVIGEVQEAAIRVGFGILKTILIGGGLGFAAAAAFTLISYRRWIADHLENALSLMFVVAVYALSNRLQHESGLLAVMVMGFALSNQRWVDVEHLVEFKENLRVLLISALFIILAARVDLAELTRLGWNGILFILVLVVLGRPLSVLVATIGSQLSVRERCFLAWMAPRGIVAAAVSSVFALRLEEVGFEQTGTLVTITFLTIIATVALYGMTAPLVARKLGLAEKTPQGLLLVGAHAWSRRIAFLLQERGFRVLLVDSNRNHTYAARMAGLPTFTGSILAEHTLDEIDLGGIGRLLALTPNDWVNVLAVHRFERIFGRANCYQLPPQKEASKKHGHQHLHGRWLFDEELTHAIMQRRSKEGFEPKATQLTEEFDYEAFLKQHRQSAIVLFIIDERGRLSIRTPESDDLPAPGQTVISLVQEMQ